MFFTQIHRQKFAYSKYFDFLCKLELVCLIDSFHKDLINLLCTAYQILRCEIFCGNKKKRYAFLVSWKPEKFLKTNKRGHDGSHAKRGLLSLYLVRQVFSGPPVEDARHTVPRFNVSFNKVFL